MTINTQAGSSGRQSTITNTMEVGGSNPSPLTKPIGRQWFGLRWAESLGRPECPYLKRWLVVIAGYSLRLHHWISSDDDRYFHDHPAWFITLVLKGGYTDSSPDGEDIMRPGRLHLRPALHRHTVKVNPGGCWTLLLFGPETRKWGFWVNGKFRKANRYFLEHGHHPCAVDSPGNREPDA